MIYTRLAALVLCGAAAACGQPDQATEPSTISAPLPAFEYFETLTEDAFTASPATIDMTLAQARAALAREAPRLPATTRTEVEARLAQVMAARANSDRTATALAAVEGFRALASAAPSTATAPVEISMLDYAGFRYAADLKASPVRWTDAAAAAAFGRTEWGKISSRVTDAALKARVDQALAQMDEASRTQNQPEAMAAALSELELVDSLETYFAKN